VLSYVTVQGGASGTGSYAYQGGHGVLASAGAIVVLVHVDARGGNGGDSKDGIGPALGGPGGHGVFLPEGGHADVLDSVFAGGIQGKGQAGAGGQVAAAIAGPGSNTMWSGSARNLGFFNVMREGQITPIQVSGETGELVVLYVSLGAGRLYMPALEGAFLLDPNALIGPFALGAISGGSVTLNVVVPDLPPGWQGLGFFMQALVTGPAGATLSAWGHLTLLDASL
jgi:hypothetical protein